MTAEHKHTHDETAKDCLNSGQDNDRGGFRKDACRFWVHVDVGVGAKYLFSSCLDLLRFWWDANKMLIKPAAWPVPRMARE